MAKVKIKLGENEVEIDSRDFYVDNQSIGEVIQSISKHIPENSAKVIYQTQSEPQNQPVYENHESAEQESTYNSLDSLEDAEIFEPEFEAPKSLASYEIKPKLKILQTSGFFNVSRTVTETVQKLREYGWSASSLDVSKVLANMAMNCEMQKSAQENRNYYSTKNQIITN